MGPNSLKCNRNKIRSSLVSFARNVEKDCSKYEKWLVKKGKLLKFVCYEVNLALIPNHTWWTNTGATTHISMTMQGCPRSWVSIDAKRFIYMGNSNKAPIEVIGLFRLQLEYGCYLDWMRLFMYHHIDEMWYLFLV